LKKKRVFIIGDSTASIYPHCGKENRFPLTGWGQVADRFLPEYQIINLALPGRSSKSFKDEENFKYLKGHLSLNDYLVIQFAHNDGSDIPERHTDTDGEFQEELMGYVRLARRAGAIAVIATPISRNRASDAWLEKYVNAIRSLAELEELPLMDFYKMTSEYINKNGSAAADAMYMNLDKYDTRFIADPRYKGSEFYGKFNRDDIHLNINGANIIAQMAADMLHSIEE